MKVRAVLLASTLFLLNSCGGGSSYGGGDGAGPAPPQPPPPSTPPPYAPEPSQMQATLPSIQEHVFTPICTQCHIGAAAPEGLRLEDGMSHAMLVNVASSQVPSLMRVSPGNPDDSYMIHKLEGTQSVGDRMPQGGPFLEADVIAIIRQWISDGADPGPTDELSLEMPTGFGGGGGGAAPPLTVEAGWPVDDGRVNERLDAIMLLVHGELDAATIDRQSILVSHLDRLDPSTFQPQRIDDYTVHLTSLAPTVIRIGLPEGLVPGRYEVRVVGRGPHAVTSRSGHLLQDGDFLMHFDVEPGR